MNKLKRLPDEMIELVRLIQKEAENKGYRITEIEALRIIANNYTNK